MIVNLKNKMNVNCKANKKKLIIPGLFIMMFFGFELNGYAQHIFSDNSCLKDFASINYFNWEGLSVKDTLVIQKADTIIAVRDFPAGDFYIHFRTIGPFLFLQVVTVDSLSQGYGLPWVIRSGDGAYQYVPLVFSSVNGNLSGRAYSEKDRFSQLTYHFISQYGIAKELFLIIKDPEPQAQGIKIKS